MQTGRSSLWLRHGGGSHRSPLPLHNLENDKRQVIDALKPTLQSDRVLYQRMDLRSWSNAKRLASVAVANRLMPIAFPPGRRRLATKPTLVGSPPVVKTIGIVDVAALAADRIAAARRTENVCQVRPLHCSKRPSLLWLPQEARGALMRHILWCTDQRQASVKRSPHCRGTGAL